MTKKIYLLTEESGFFGQRMMPWESIDLKRLKQELSAEYEVIQITYEELACSDLELRDQIILHSSSQQPEYKAYIEDILLYLLGMGNTLIPSIHTTRSHENKGYQELHKRLVGLPSLNSVYLTKRSARFESEVDLPVVFKDLSGFGSGGVTKVRTQEQLDQATAPSTIIDVQQFARIVRQTLGYCVRRYVLRRRNLRPYGDYYKPLKRFVLQEFIPQLTCDYKVLIFQDHAFVLKRNVRPNDFRASGSGDFEFIDPPAQLLSYAYSVLTQLDEPYMSLDIVEADGRFSLIEFQGVHFGPFTVTQSPFHYRKDADEWVREDGPADLEEHLARAIRLYLQRNRKMLALAG